ncbi:MAG: aminopeptidase [Clostridia bacterium]|nr:aminopeptidase [Clostridia bacterium]
MSETKSAAKQLKDRLALNRKNGRLQHNDETLQKADTFCQGYVSFLDAAKTERRAVEAAIRLAEEKGFVPFCEDKTYRTGDKVYVNNRGKALILAVIGQKPVSEGVRIAAAHIDSPRLDLKPNPLYEDCELALLKTHYYGGIKKYQWTALPLALYGVIVKADGSKVEVSIGDRDDEPCFVITDLLPHLATEQSKRPLSQGIKGEELNVLVGSHPFRDDEASELVKLNILNLLHEKYGITEEDFLSAELECVPALQARDIGFDRSMIGAYGHDDRVCAYPSLMAALDVQNPTHTVITVLADKEETGSDGNTGLQSAYLQYFIEDLAAMQGTAGYRVLRNSKCLSADVNAALDPTFPDVVERKNAAMLNYGAVITKYTGARGKGDTSDASAEYVGEIRKMLNDANIAWQTGELGKVDLGGGGTVAKYIANLGVDVVDLGVPVLSMHSPYEVVSKFDVYMTYRTVLEFFK